MPLSRSASLLILPVTTLLTLPFLWAQARAASNLTIEAVAAPPVGGERALYVANRKPLRPNPLMRLPIGSIRPEGWLRAQLELQAQGMVGHLEEISPWCVAEGNAWLHPEGEGHSPWEELPYWLKGYGDLGYVLGDRKIISRARKWLEGVLGSQREDGYFGPQVNRTNHDLWPNMIMLNCLRAWFEHSGDTRVLDFMERYFRWQLALPDADFLPGSWQKIRGGDNLLTVLWLYNRTGEPFLLELAERLHAHTGDWTSGIASWHGVNICQCFREPAVFFQLAKERKFLDASVRNYHEVMEKYGQVPGGMFGADENCRPGYSGPRQAAETCSMVEFMRSFEILFRITGDPVWADRCEDVAFNSLPAAFTPDLKALHYLTAPNMVVLDRKSKSPELQNGGCMLAYSPYQRYRCCQHNVAFGWPYLAEELWHATYDGGLCASFLMACRVTARVGKDADVGSGDKVGSEAQLDSMGKVGSEAQLDSMGKVSSGTEVSIAVNTDYPFTDRVELVLTSPRPVRFPLYVRIPTWCHEAKLTVEGSGLTAVGKGGQFLRVTGSWREKERLTLTLPMSISVRTWAKNKNSVSVDRGPLTYALNIDGAYKRMGGSNAWPELELIPTEPWNYGLVLDRENLAASFTHSSGAPAAVEREAGLWQPFTPVNAPVALKTTARQIPEWRLERGLVGKLQESPAFSDEPIEELTLIPMGAARLRISAFPTVDAGPTAHRWEAPPLPPGASHCWRTDTTWALNDGKLPRSSNDQSIPRFTWWNHKGTDEWVAYKWKRARTISKARVYWFDDTTIGGGCALPVAWRLLYRKEGRWTEVPNPSGYGVAADQFSEVVFSTVQTREVRLEVQLKPGFSGGILEWEMGD